MFHIRLEAQEVAVVLHTPFTVITYLFLSTDSLKMLRSVPSRPQFKLVGVKTVLLAHGHYTIDSVAQIIENSQEASQWR